MRRSLHALGGEPRLPAARLGQICVDLGVLFCTQIGHTGPLKRSETGRLIPYLEEVMLEFPELKVVGGHVGFPWIDELVTMTVKFPNF